jgi:hypothetical protein
MRRLAEQLVAASWQVEKHVAKSLRACKQSCSSSHAKRSHRFSERRSDVESRQPQSNFVGRETSRNWKTRVNSFRGKSHDDKLGRQFPRAGPEFHRFPTLPQTAAARRPSYYPIPNRTKLSPRSWRVTVPSIMSSASVAKSRPVLSMVVGCALVIFISSSSEHG